MDGTQLASAPTRAGRRSLQSRVLVVDHDQILRELLSESFDSTVVDVHTASDSACAERELATFAPDVVVLGVSIPSADRFAFCRRLMDKDGESAVGVVLVPAADGESLDAVVAAAPNVFVRRPFDPGSIVACAAGA